MKYWDVKCTNVLSSRDVLFTLKSNPSILFAAYSTGSNLRVFVGPRYERGTVVPFSGPVPRNEKFFSQHCQLPLSSPEMQELLRDFPSVYTKMCDNERRQGNISTLKSLIRVEHFTEEEVLQLWREVQVEDVQNS